MAQLGLELYSQYVTAMGHKANAPCRYIGISSKMYRPFYGEKEFITIAKHVIPLSPLIISTRDLVDTLEKGKRILTREMNADFGKIQNDSMMRLGDVKDVFKSLHSRAVLFCLETLKLLMFKLEPATKEDAKPFFAFLTRDLTKIDNAYLQAVDELENKHEVTKSLKDELLDIVSAFALEMITQACTQYSDCLWLNTVTVTTPEWQPCAADSINLLLSEMKRSEFHKLEELFEYYDYAYDLHFENQVYEHFAQHYVLTGNTDYDGADFAFYKFYSDCKTLNPSLKLTKIFGRVFAEQIERRKTALSENDSFRIKLFDTAATHFGDLLQAVAACPYITDDIRTALNNRVQAAFKELKSRR